MVRNSSARSQARSASRPPTAVQECEVRAGVRRRAQEGRRVRAGCGRLLPPAEATGRPSMLPRRSAEDRWTGGALSAPRHPHSMPAPHCTHSWHSCPQSARGWRPARRAAWTATSPGRCRGRRPTPCAARLWAKRSGVGAGAGATDGSVDCSLVQCAVHCAAHRQAGGRVRCRPALPTPQLRRTHYHAAELAQAPLLRQAVDGHVCLLDGAHRHRLAAAGAGTVGEEREVCRAAGRRCGYAQCRTRLLHAASKPVARPRAHRGASSCAAAPSSPPLKPLTEACMGRSTASRCSLFSLTMET